VAEAPELDRFYRDEAGRAGLLVVAVSDNLDAVQGFRTKGEFTFPVMLDSDGVAGRYGVRAIPTVVVIDSAGRVAKTIVGGVSEADLSKLVDDLTG
jgi:thioredoxin-like negative regulator of GroEL